MPRGLLALLCVVATVTTLWSSPSYAQVPPKAEAYKRDLIRNARFYWGFDAPIATFASQIHQESGWHPEAKSFVGASGLAQFMPSTADWISGVYRTDLGENQPLNPMWALRALIIYDKFLWDRVTGVTACDRMAFTLASYNGGLGWVYRDKRLSAASGHSSQIWFGHVEKFNAGRAKWAFEENRGYPHRILRVIQPRYELWGDSIICL